MRPQSQSNLMNGSPESGSAGSPDDLARNLLRKLRDLNLHASFPGASGTCAIRLEGCLSVDRPVEDSVRYAVRLDGEPRELDILLRQGVIELVLEGAETQEERRSRHEFARGTNGLVRVDGVGEVAVDETRPEEIERFLLGLVRQASRRRAG
jgi:hypothetical protein